MKWKLGILVLLSLEILVLVLMIGKLCILIVGVEEILICIMV